MPFIAGQAHGVNPKASKFLVHHRWVVRHSCVSKLHPYVLQLEYVKRSFQRSSYIFIYSYYWGNVSCATNQNHNEYLHSPCKHKQGCRDMSVLAQWSQYTRCSLQGGSYPLNPKVKVLIIAETPCTSLWQPLPLHLWFLLLKAILNYTIGKNNHLKILLIIAF